MIEPITGQTRYEVARRIHQQWCPVEDICRGPAVSDWDHTDRLIDALSTSPDVVYAIAAGTVDVSAFVAAPLGWSGKVVRLEGSAA